MGLGSFGQARTCINIILLLVQYTAACPLGFALQAPTEHLVLRVEVPGLGLLLRSVSGGSAMSWASTSRSIGCQIDSDRLGVLFQPR